MLRLAPAHFQNLVHSSSRISYRKHVHSVKRTKHASIKIIPCKPLPGKGKAKKGRNPGKFLPKNSQIRRLRHTPHSLQDILHPGIFFVACTKAGCRCVSICCSPCIGCQSSRSLRHRPRNVPKHFSHLKGTQEKKILFFIFVSIS